MTGNEGDVSRYVETRLLFKNPQSRDRNRHQRRLGVFSQCKGLGWTAPDRFTEPLAQGGVDLVEDMPSRSKCVGQSLTHSNGLAALARENQRSCHWLLFALLDHYAPKAGGKNTAMALMSR